jgi:phthiocerol/phenolphthiocerol synthesis type-I polyketide synthase D
MAAVDRPAAGDGVTAGIEPRDAAERLVARVVAEALGVTPGVTDDLRAIDQPPTVRQLISQRLSAEIGCHIDAARLFAVPTIEAAADVVRTADEAEVDGAVRLIRAGGESPPVLLAHPAGGTTGVYKALASMLGGRRAVFGLERLEGPLTERAARYAEAILGRFPGGGWVLGGWSFGGVLAYETARQLAAAGHRVGQVVLLDAALPLPIPAATEGEVLAHRFAAFADYLTATYGRKVPLDAEELLGVDEEAQLGLLTERMSAAGLAGVLSPAIMRHQIDSHTDTRTLERYQPQGYDGPVHLYRADRQTPWAVRDQRYEITSQSRGWDALCPSLTVAAIDCHHLNLLDPPAVQAVASHLRALLSSQEGT